ncbi:inorganic pyrophosphatase family protein [Bordetella holmesii 70147]|nr:inorganic pyrophosphatase family protein [Bordetella holmesii 70147]
MSFERVPAGKSLPDDFNVIIEIPMNADPVKYEVDKESDAIFVDRFMLTAMHYPCNYGYIPQTLSEDGDPADVLVITPFPIQIGAVVRCRALGVLEMDDESGGDAKLLAVPVDKLYPPYRNIKSYEDLPPRTLPGSSTFSSTTKTSKKVSGSRSRSGRAWMLRMQRSCAAQNATARATKLPRSARQMPGACDQDAAATVPNRSPPRFC